MGMLMPSLSPWVFSTEAPECSGKYHVVFCPPENQSEMEITKSAAYHRVDEPNTL
eukprot:gene22733-9165_t